VKADALVTFAASSDIFLGVLPPQMANQTERPKATVLQVFLALFAGLLPYVGAALVVTLTRGIGWVALASAAICVISTSAAYAMRKSTDPVNAKQRLMIDPALYGSEFAFTAVLIRYVFIRHGDVQIFNIKMGSPAILCVLGAISWLVMGLWARSLKVGPPTSRAHLSVEQRQKRIRLASWILLGGAFFFVIAAILFAWLQQTGAG
jgi:hypothetical protein